MARWNLLQATRDTAGIRTFLAGLDAQGTRAPRSILATIGLKAMRDGDRPRARAAFARAIRVDPYRLKNYLRWMRTWLPHRLAQSLSGGSSRRARSDRAYQE